jgi:putative spermidine/putrescine transport system ATP-binding protein
MTSPPSAPASLQLLGVTKRFGAAVVVHPLRLRIEGGQMLALLGPSGCGKTTTLRMIAGFEQPDQGQVIVADRDVTMLRPARRRLGMVFQNYSLFPHMTVGQNVAFGLRMQSIGRADRDTRTRQILDMVQLSQMADRFPRQLSGGQQQRVALARSLVTNPQILLLDEPLGALDKNLRESMQFELRGLQQRFGITSLLVTHDQEEALSMSDQVAVMNAGRIEQIASPGDIYDRPATRFVSTFLGTSNIFSGRPDGAGALRTGPDGTARVLLPGPAGGESVTLSVRPERLSLGSESGGLANCFPAEVHSIAFRGAYAAYELYVPALGQTVYAYCHPQGGLGKIAHAPGSQVMIGWRPEDGVIVEDHH